MKWRQQGNQGNELWEAIFMPTPILCAAKGRVIDFYFTVWKIFSCTSSQVQHSRRTFDIIFLSSLCFWHVATRSKSCPLFSQKILLCKWKSLVVCCGRLSSGILSLSHVAMHSLFVLGELRHKKNVIAISHVRQQKWLCLLSLVYFFSVPCAFVLLSLPPHSMSLGLCSRQSVKHV